MLLACESHFSHHHRSTLSPKKIVALAKERGHFMIGIADRQSLAGSLEFSKAAIAAGLKPVIGERLRFGDPITSGYITLHVMNETGWKNLLRLNSCFFTKRKGGLIELEDLAAHAEGLFVTTGGIDGPVDQAIIQNRIETAEKFLKALDSVFGGHLAIAFDRHSGMDASDNAREALLAQWCLHYRIPGIAISPARHSGENDRVALNVLTFAADGNARTTIKDPSFPAPPIGSHLKSVEEFETLFAESASLIENTLCVLMLNNFALVESKPRLPRAPGVADENAAVIKAAREGLDRRFRENPYMAERRPDYEERLQVELGHITKLGFSGYFLIVSDFINWSRANDIPVGPGRGSGAGSLVAWCLGITELDPLRWDLLFERFINPERISLPDFDVDFCEKRRDEVLDYVRTKYGADHVAHIAAYNTLKGRGAFKATARAIGIPAGIADSFTKKFPEKGDGLRTFREEPAVRDALADNIELEEAMTIAEQLEGVLDNATKHAAGIVISDEPLPKTTPIMGVLDEGRIVPVTQFDMGPIEKTGLVKFDFLGLKTLTVITRTKNILAAQGIDIDPYSIPYEDDLVFKYLNEGRTQRVFQLESPGMTSALKKVRPNTFEDIVALVSLYRPGPMDQIPLYADRKAGRTPVEYPHPKLEPVLKETYGIIVYQEQIMEAARVLAGYSLGEADVLRRAIGKKKADELKRNREQFISRCESHSDIPRDQGAKLFDTIERFADYGFNKSHAAAYARIAWITAWLKTHHTVAFMAANMDYDRSDADKLEAVVREAERIGITILPPDINISTATFDPEGKHAIRFPLAGLTGISGSTAADIVRNRADHGPFRSASDAVARLFDTGLNRSQITTLIDAGAFDGLIDHSTRERRSDLREIVSNMTGGKVDRSAPSLFGDLQSETEIDAQRRIRRQALAQGRLPPPPPQAISEEIDAETKAIGFRLRNHPADAYKILSYRIAASPVSAVTKVRGDATFTVIAQVEAIYPAKDRRPAGIDGSGVELIISDSTGRTRIFAESPNKAPQPGDVAVMQLVSRFDGRILSNWQTPDDARKSSSPAVVVQADSRLTTTPARELETLVKTSIRLYGKGGTYRLVYFNAGPANTDGPDTQQNEIKTLFNRVNPTAEFLQSVQAIDGIVSVSVEA